MITHGEALRKALVRGEVVVCGSSRIPLPGATNVEDESLLLSVVTVRVHVAVDGAAKTLAARIVTSALDAIAGETGLRGVNPDSDEVSISADVSGAPGTYWHVDVRHTGAGPLNTLDVRVTATPLNLVD